MARVVVTGGAGKLGRACVDELIGHGWDVVVFDRVRPPSEGCGVHSDRPHRLRTGAGRDVGSRPVRADAVVHLAAVPAPGSVPDHLPSSTTWGAPGTSSARPAGSGSPTWCGLPARPCSGCRSTHRVHAGGQGYPPRPVDLVTGQDARRGDGGSAMPLEPGPEDDRTAVLEHDRSSRYADCPAFEEVAPGVRKWNPVRLRCSDDRDDAQAVRLALESDLTGVEVFIIAETRTLPSRGEQYRADRRVLSAASRI